MEEGGYLVWLGWTLECGMATVNWGGLVSVKRDGWDSWGEPPLLLRFFELCSVFSVLKPNCSVFCVFKKRCDVGLCCK